IGYHILAKSEMTTQVICKQDPQEKVGNVVSIDGKLHVIEYSDLPPEQAKRQDQDGNLVLWAGSIAVHVFDTAFLLRMVDDADSLPFHHARKKVPHIDARGVEVEPDAPNAIKFERFIFDLLPHAQRAIVVEVDEARAFAPLKNASGAPKDTPESVHAAILAEHRRWLEAAGVRVPEGVRVEISPAFALNEAELIERRDQIEPIQGDQFLK
ncbi:MAG: UTP--glucose-1-phosphate uridylyltransferase, partial [Planctomycetota bacterium]